MSYLWYSLTMGWWQSFCEILINRHEDMNKTSFQKTCSVDLKIYIISLHCCSSYMCWLRLQQINKQGVHIVLSVFHKDMNYKYFLNKERKSLLYLVNVNIFWYIVNLFPRYINIVTRRYILVHAIYGIECIRRLNF